MRIVRAFVVMLVAGLLGAAPPAAAPVIVKLIAINDFHGYLQPSEVMPLPDPGDATKTVRVPVGGAAYLATTIARLKAGNPKNVVVGAGDMVGASPLTSALFHDEPAIQALSAMGLEYTSVGNHEFDEGTAELLRKQNGGCRPAGKIGADTCMINGTFAGAGYHYLAANVIVDATGKTLFPPYAIKYFPLAGGKKLGIAFIGLVLKDTPTVTTAAGVRGVHFLDEADAVKNLLPEINAQGVHAIVVLIHQGIFTSVGFNDHSCAKAFGDLLPVLDRLDPSIKLVVSGHTHRAYICPNGQGSTNTGVYYTSAGRYGQIVSDIDVSIDPATDTIVHVDANNALVVNDKAPNRLATIVPAVPPVAPIAALVDRYVGASSSLVNRIVGHVTADFALDGEEITRGASGESEMGDLIADARVEVTKNPPQLANIAFINAGGIRSSLHYAAALNERAPGDVTYGALYSVEPFGDLLGTETLTGAQVLHVLDEQWIGKKDTALLGVSRGLTYTWDANKPDGASKIVPGSVMFNGKPLDPAATFRVTVDDFLLGGGDGFPTFTHGTGKVSGPIDLDALIAYLAAHSPLTPGPRDRIVRLH